MRRLYTLSAAASFLTLAAIVAVWVRSYSSFDTVSVIHRFGDSDVPGHGFTGLSISWSLGTLNFGGGTVLDRLPPSDDRVTWSSFPVAQLMVRDSPWLKFRSHYTSQPDRPSGWSRGTIVRRWGVTMPCWVIALPAAVLPPYWAKDDSASGAPHAVLHEAGAPVVATTSE